jgi:hypothetical protein
MNKKISLIIGLFISVTLSAQTKIWDTFEGTRVLNNHSTEMLYKKNLEFIVAHKFGDLAGSNGGLQNFYGLDNLADVRIAFEYGVTTNFDIGVGRSKGVGILNQMLDGYAKYRFLQQEDKGMPISLTLVSSMASSYRKPSEDSTSAASYSSVLERLIFTNQILISKKVNNRLSLQINAGYHHRNLVAFDDVNGLFFTGGVIRFRITENFGVLTEYNHLWNTGNGSIQKDPLSFGIELLTGGHNFTLVFSNGKGLNENVFLGNTTSNWLDGEFRFGFSINRRFKL